MLSVFQGSHTSTGFRKCKHTVSDHLLLRFPRFLLVLMMIGFCNKICSPAFSTAVTSLTRVEVLQPLCFETNLLWSKTKSRSRHCQGSEALNHTSYQRPTNTIYDGQLHRNIRSALLLQQRQFSFYCLQKLPHKLERSLSSSWIKSGPLKFSSR